jgi:ribose-phosphate pyrophosphokinase
MSQISELRVYGGIKLYAGTSCPELSQKVAEYLGENLCGRDIVEFPNENLFVKLHASVRGQDVYVMQHTASPVNRTLMELLI